jgi:hypothetical protein
MAIICRNREHLRECIDSPACKELIPYVIKQRIGNDLFVMAESPEIALFEATRDWYAVITYREPATTPRLDKLIASISDLSETEKLKLLKSLGGVTP